MVIVKSEIKKVVFNHIKLKYAGTFEGKKNWLGGEISLFRKTSYGYDTVPIVFSTHNSYILGPAKLCHTSVEDIYLQATAHKKMDASGYYPATLKWNDIRQDGSLFDQPYAVPGSIQSEADLVSSMDMLDQYMRDVAIPFFERYIDPRIILQTMDQLEAEGKYWHEILFGGPEYFFRALIISWLCGDQRYAQKKEIVDSFMLNPEHGLTDYQDDYKKLLAYLGRQKPLYKV